MAKTCNINSSKGGSNTSTNSRKRQLATRLTRVYVPSDTKNAILVTFFPENLVDGTKVYIVKADMHQ